MTHREIEQRYADLPIDLSDEGLVRHLVRGSGKMLLAHGTLKGALKALVPERPGDTIAADAVRRALGEQS